YNECKAKAGKWLQANSQKSKPSKPDAESDTKGLQNKRSQTRPPQHHQKYRDQQVERNTGRTAIKRENTSHPAERTRPARSAKADVACAKQSTESMQNQAPAAKKSFLQRVLQRIFGK
ncbi:MAG TPA: hypothetical protein VHP38_13765, partial [Ruminiclostridium sp.]|nr:hypothetical protein [Ruminiclostridium sp.]